MGKKLKKLPTPICLNTESYNTNWMKLKNELIWPNLLLTRCEPRPETPSNLINALIVHKNIYFIIDSFKKNFHFIFRSIFFFLSCRLNFIGGFFLSDLQNKFHTLNNCIEKGFIKTCPLYLISQFHFKIHFIVL